MFRDLTPAQINLLPTYQGELLMQTHGVGCYTAHPEMKRYNRQNDCVPMPPSAVPSWPTGCRVGELIRRIK